MSATHIIVGLIVGVAIGAMDFSLARSITSLIRPSNAQAAQAIILVGFIVRLGAIGILLWTLSRASNVSFLGVCVGLTGAFTVLTLRQTLKSFVNASREQKRVTDRR